MVWEISWADMCRTCMEMDGDLQPLYSGEGEINENDIAYKLVKLAPVEIDKYDGLPTKICDKCAYRTHAFYDFQCLIQESDKKLKQILNEEMIDCAKDEQINDQVENTYDSPEIQLQDCFSEKNESEALFSNNKFEIVSQTLNDQGTNTQVVENLDNVCNTVILNVEDFDNSSDVSAKLDVIHVTIQCNDLNVVENIDEAQFLENQTNYEIQEQIILHSNAAESENTNKITDDFNDPLSKIGDAIENDKILENLDAKTSKSKDDSDDYLDARESIIGNLNDTVTKIKEVKEGNKISYYQCTLCSQNYKELSEVLCHAVDLHVPTCGPFYCVICEKDCDSIKQLKAHVKTHKGPCPYRCFICNKTYAMKRYLKRHMGCHTDFARHRCLKCGERFKVKKELENHFYTTHLEESYKCDQCPRVFNHKGNYKRHLVMHLDPKGEYLPKYPCQICNRRFLNNRTLTTHMRVHTGEKPFTCEICGKSFSQQGNLINHQRIHVNPRSYKCDICGKSFNQKSTLKDHGALHSGEKPYVCSICKKAFTFSSALRRHMWSHSDGKPYECDICNAKFIGRYDLKRHINIHNSKPKKKKPTKKKDLKKDVPFEEDIDTIDNQLNGDTIFVEQILLSEDAIQIITQGDSEKENVDSLFGFIHNESNI